MKNKLPLYLENTFKSIYGNFGERFSATLLESLLLSPMTILFLYINTLSLNNYYFILPISQILTLVYFVYLPVKYGATPGKLIMGLTILKSDGSNINYKDAFMKYLPVLILSLFSVFLHIHGITKANENNFNGLSWFEKTKYIQSFSQPLNYIIVGLVNIFYFVNVIVFLLNDRKQSVGDQLADTVVVYKRHLNKINEINE
ncbi:RDD family protein [Flavobacterium sp.]|uniref:RDD family protein n=1 Tax=Flavobacterium sp. TaxID=239 RepID=UPI003750DE3A